MNGRRSRCFAALFFCFFPGMRHPPPRQAACSMSGIHVRQTKKADAPRVIFFRRPEHKTGIRGSGHKKARRSGQDERTPLSDAGPVPVSAAFLSESAPCHAGMKCRAMRLRCLAKAPLLLISPSSSAWKIRLCRLPDTVLSTMPPLTGPSPARPMLSSVRKLTIRFAPDERSTILPPLVPFQAVRAPVLRGTDDARLCAFLPGRLKPDARLLQSCSRLRHHHDVRSPGCTSAASFPPTKPRHRRSALPFPMPDT